MCPTIVPSLHSRLFHFPCWHGMKVTCFDALQHTRALSWRKWRFAHFSLHKMPKEHFASSSWQIVSRPKQNIFFFRRLAMYILSSTIRTHFWALNGIELEIDKRHLPRKKNENCDIITQPSTLNITKHDSVHNTLTAPKQCCTQAT